MKITDVKATPVAVPLEKADTRSKMRKGPNAVIAVIVEVYTDEGVVGIGETPAVLGLDLSTAIVNSTRPILVGRDPSDINVLMKRLYVMYNANHLHSMIHGGIPEAISPPSTHHLTEDLPYGLVPISDLAKKVGIATPHMDGLITLASTFNGEDYFTIGRSLKNLGLKDKTVREIINFAIEGK